MKWADKTDLKLRSPATAVRVNALLGGNRLVDGAPARLRASPTALLPDRPTSAAGHPPPAGDRGRPTLPPFGSSPGAGSP